MIPPIIVYEHGDMMIFESTELAENYVEAIDVANGEYIVYDRQGTLLNIELDSQTLKVSIRDNKTVTNRSEQLQKILVDYLRVMQVKDSWIQGASLDDLVNKAFYLYTQ